MCTNEEECIEEALEHATCRCCAFDGNCALGGGERSYCIKNALRLAGERHTTDPTTTWDMDEARSLLRANGWFRVMQGQPRNEGSSFIPPDEESVKVRFEQGEMLSLDTMLRELNIALASELPRLLPSSIRGCYGVEEKDMMTSARFIRLLFVVFQEKSKTAKAPAIRGAEPSISQTTSLIDVKHSRGDETRYARMQMRFRFYTNANEPVEVKVCSKDNIS